MSGNSCEDDEECRTDYCAETGDEDDSTGRCKKRGQDVWTGDDL